jgi:putative transposase
MLVARGMGHPLRWFIPAIVYEITTKTMQDRFLLRPSAEAREIILGILGRAQQLYGRVRLHAFVFLSNHAHMLASADEGESLSAFVGYVNGRVAWEMGRLHGWRGHFWGRRNRPIPILDDDAVVARLRYLISQGCKEGLVASPLEWPGASALPALVGDMQLEGVWFARDQERRARARGEAPGRYDHAIRYRVQLEPIPPWKDLSEAELQRRHCELVESVTAEVAEQRNVPPVGVAKVLAVDPHAAPAESSRSPAPLCHTSRRELRDWFRASYRAFVAAFRLAANALRRLGPASLPQPFPPGAFPPRLQYTDALPVSWHETASAVLT